MEQPIQSKSGFKTREFAIAIAVVLVVVILIVPNLMTLLNVLYSPVAALIAVIILVEFLILKGTDRSAQYRRALEAVRHRRGETLLAMRDIEVRLQELNEKISEAETESSDQLSLKAVHDELTSILEELRSRI